MTRDVIIGLDLATRTGWAVLRLDGERIDSGAWTLAPRKGRSKADRWVRFARALSELLRAYDGRVAVVAIERPFESRGSGGRGASVAWGLVALAEHAATTRGIEAVRFAVAAVKKAATGRGNATKIQVAKAVSKRHGVSLPGGDEADALAVAGTALDLLDLEALACGELVERGAA